MAFGGVATGSMNAQLAPNTVGIASKNGFSPNPIATEAKIGKNAAVDAVLLVISVKKTISAITIKMIKMIGQVFRLPIPEPIHVASPVLLIADAILNPPPKRINTPHGNRFVSDHFSKNRFSSEFAGIIKKATAAPIAIPASDNPGIAEESKGRNIQSNAAETNTTATFFS